MKIKNSVILITGAAKRIGRAIALNLAASQAHLILHYHRSNQSAKGLARKIQTSFNGDVHLLKADLSQTSQVKNLADEAWNFKKRIDVLINNASVFFPTPLGDIQESEWDYLFNVNAKAPFFLSEAIGKKMKKRQKGKIINIADWSMWRPDNQYLPYAASKAALFSLSQGLARNFAPEVQVNTIAPGPIIWPPNISGTIKQSVLKKTPLGRVGNPQDIAQAVRFFIEGTDFSTGAFLHVDGGRNIY